MTSSIITTPAPGLILPVSQSFVPSAQLAAGSPPQTRRVIQALGAGALGSGLASNQDLNLRIGLTWPASAIRMRLRIRNANVLANTFNTTPVAMTGSFIGAPNTAAENAWAGDFVSAPTSLGLSFAATDIGTTEYVSAWVTPAGQVANQFFGLSLGFTCATDSEINVDDVPGWLFHGATGAGAAAAAGNAAIPSGGGIAALPTRVPFDLRIEYEFVGRNQIGFFIGDSLTAGYMAGAAVSTPYGHVGPDSAWPGQVGRKLGHGICNGGVGGSSTPKWNNETHQIWTRFTDPTTGTIFGGTTPDYAVILLGVNDATGGVSLATYQSNIQTMIGFLQGLGIYRIYLCTAPIGTVTNQGAAHLPTFQNGLLNTALVAGATTSIVIQPVTTTAGAFQTAYPSAPGGGLTAGTGSGPATNWYDAAAVINDLWLEVPASGIAEGPLTVTAVAGATTLTATVTSFVLANAHKVGAPVLAGAEGLRQNYNFWIGQLPPGIVGVIDMAALATADGAPPFQKHWAYYGQSDSPHPVTPALYGLWASAFAAGLVGL